MSISFSEKIIELANRQQPVVAETRDPKAPKTNPLFNFHEVISNEGIARLYNESLESPFDYSWLNKIKLASLGENALSDDDYLRYSNMDYKSTLNLFNERLELESDPERKTLIANCFVDIARDLPSELALNEQKEVFGIARQSNEAHRVDAYLLYMSPINMTNATVTSALLDDGFISYIKDERSSYEPSDMEKTQVVLSSLERASLEGSLPKKDGIYEASALSYAIADKFYKPIKDEMKNQSNRQTPNILTLMLSDLPNLTEDACRVADNSNSPVLATEILSGDYGLFRMGLDEIGSRNKNHLTEQALDVIVRNKSSSYENIEKIANSGALHREDIPLVLSMVDRFQEDNFPADRLSLDKNLSKRLIDNISFYQEGSRNIGLTRQDHDALLLAISSNRNLPDFIKEAAGALGIEAYNADDLHATSPNSITASASDEESVLHRGRIIDFSSMAIVGHSKEHPEKEVGFTIRSFPTASSLSYTLNALGSDEGEWSFSIAEDEVSRTPVLDEVLASALIDMQQNSDDALMRTLMKEDVYASVEVMGLQGKRLMQDIHNSFLAGNNQHLVDSEFNRPLEHSKAVLDLGNDNHIKIAEIKSTDDIDNMLNNIEQAQKISVNIESVPGDILFDGGIRDNFLQSLEYYIQEPLDSGVKSYLNEHFELTREQFAERMDISIDELLAPNASQNTLKETQQSNNNLNIGANKWKL